MNSDLQNFYSDFEAYESDLKNGNEETLSWIDITSAIKVEPHFEERSLALVKATLGYLPKRHVYLPYMGFISALLKNKPADLKLSSEHQSEDDLQILYYLKCIRNDAVRKGGWLNHLFPTEGDYQFFNSYMPGYIVPTRERLTSFLGYTPEPQHSLFAEAYLRPYLAADPLHANELTHEMICKVATIAHYRKNYLEKGNDAAAGIEFITSFKPYAYC